MTHQSLQSQHPGYELKALKAVTVQRGLCVHIPCNFTYPTSQYSGELYVYWIKNDRAGSYIGNIWHPNAGSVVASSDKDQSIASFAGNRFQLTGNLSEGDCSFSINDVQNQDEGQYYFRIEKGPILKFSYHLYILPHVSVTGKRFPTSLFAPSFPISWSNFPGPATAQNHQHSNGSWTFASGFTFTPTLQDQGRALTCHVYYPAVRRTVENTISLEVVLFLHIPILTELCWTTNSCLGISEWGLCRRKDFRDGWELGQSPGWWFGGGEELKTNWMVTGRGWAQWVFPAAMPCHAHILAPEPKFTLHRSTLQALDLGLLF
uniref:Ig-like domain-containing protein n=1 Tax=Podarcis muralis TaxID=64176 RepID=A0A670IGZ4_PODMU